MIVARVSPVTQPVPWIRIRDVRSCEDRKNITGEEEEGQEMYTEIMTRQQMFGRGGVLGAVPC